MTAALIAAFTLRAESARIPYGYYALVDHADLYKHIHTQRVLRAVYVLMCSNITYMYRPNSYLISDIVLLSLCYLQWSHIITVTAPDSDGYCDVSADAINDAVDLEFNITIVSRVQFTEDIAVIPQATYDDLKVTARSASFSSVF